MNLRILNIKKFDYIVLGCIKLVIENKYIFYIKTLIYFVNIFYLKHLKFFCGLVLLHLNNVLRR